MSSEQDVRLLSQFAICELVVPSCFLIFHVPGHGFQKGFLQNLPGDWREVCEQIGPQICLPAHPEDACELAFSQPLGTSPVSSLHILASILSCPMDLHLSNLLVHSPSLPRSCLGQLRTELAGKDQSKEDLEFLSLFYVLCYQVCCLI